MKKIFIVIILIIALLLITGCGDNYDNQIAAVQNSMSDQAWDNFGLGADYEAGKLEGGVAVLADNIAAYWVKDGIVYAVNGTASSYSPLLDYAPSGIDLAAVEDAVN